MGNNKWFKAFLVLFVILSFTACNKRQHQQDQFTLESGIKIVSEENKCNTYEKIKPEILMLKKEKAYLVSLTDVFSCSNHESAYLTLNTFKKSSLIFYGKNSDGCECVKSLKVKIDSKRIDPGDVLYILSNREVIDHVIVP